ncbi:hypothetical protein LCGC14_0568170 [marine sediment metagenome]|uniref:Uncharacterized protein n=1 Tax=marine sediment metagenome TaxID=412755 RepID=A0A0F9RJX3_9ZZZZ
MAEANRDQNRVETVLGVSSTDGVTPLEAEINPVTGKLRVDGKDTSPVVTIGTEVPRDNNRVTIACAQRIDNGEPMPIHINVANGRWLTEV